mmetsp:Transcript_47389/g.42482  ORF Transcript_47389/g.42482 Transcript_47389/m.42482 type:complete len:400 (+) Transcript_47389:101-1300(+)
MAATPQTPIPKPKGGVDESTLMDFAAALAITLPRNLDINKITVYINDTGEPAQGYVGDALVKHCKEWTSIKSNEDIVNKLQGLMYFKIFQCVAIQAGGEKKWVNFQNEDTYLYGFDQSKINIYKCPSRGSNFVDKSRWKKQHQDKDANPESPSVSLTKNDKVNKGGIVSETHGASVQVTFTTAVKAATGGKDVKSVTTNSKVMRVKEKAQDYRLTQSQIEYRRAKAQEQRSKINQSQKNKGKKEWKWKTNEQQKKKEALAKQKKQEEEKKKKAREEKGKQGGGGGVVSAVSHFEDEKTDPDRFKHLEKESDKTNLPKSDTAVRNRLVSYDNKSYPIGSDDIAYYETGQICSVWSQQKKEWVDGEILEIIKFVKTIKIKFDGKTQQFRLPNTDMVRLKPQ